MTCQLLGKEIWHQYMIPKITKCLLPKRKRGISNKGWGWNTAISYQKQFNKIVIISIRRHNDENFLNSDDFPRVDLFIYAQSPE